MVVTYNVAVPTGPGQYTDCQCQIIASITEKQEYYGLGGGYGLSVLNKITITKTPCRSDVPYCNALTIYAPESMKFCEGPTAPDLQCNLGTYGMNAFVYFNGLTSAVAYGGSSAEAASAGTDATESFEDAATEEANATPSTAPATSAAFRTTPLPFLISMLALFLGNKRVAFVCILLASVSYSSAAPDPREVLGGALGWILNDYVQSIGTCKAFVSETLLRSGIDGRALQKAYYQSPVGAASYTGPKLEYIPSRTYLKTGDFCTPISAVIPANGFRSVTVGDSTWGLASAVSLGTIISSRASSPRFPRLRTLFLECIFLSNFYIFFSFAGGVHLLQGVQA
jgi:hypothetical protein